MVESLLRYWKARKMRWAVRHVAGMDTMARDLWKLRPIWKASALRQVADRTRLKVTEGATWAEVNIARLTPPLK